MKNSNIMSKAATISLMIVLIAFPFFINNLPKPYLNTAFAQTQTTYSMSIKDESGEEIGNYFDIQIDSLAIMSNTTMNFQMIPNLAIQDSSLRQKYSTFLEMLLRNTANEVEAIVHPERAVGIIDTKLQRWNAAIFDFGNYDYEGLDYSDRFRTIGDEINSLTALNIIKGGHNAAIIVDYSSRESSKIEVTSFDSLGIPLKGVLFKKSFALNANELDRDIRLAYLRALLLNNNPDEDLLTDDGNFTQDAIHILKIVYSFQNGSNLGFHENEKNRSPVAIARVSSDSFLTGQQIELIGTESRDPDGSIRSYFWRQLHGGPKTLDYMTENESRLTNPDSAIAQFTAEWPGNYRYELLVEDDKGALNKSWVDVLVITETENKFTYLVNNLLDFKENDISSLEQATLDKIAYNAGGNCVEFVNTFWYTQVEPLPIIDRLLGDPFQQITDPFIINFIAEAKKRNFRVVLSQQLYPAPGVPFPSNDPKSQEWWDAWFDQVEPIILEQAMLAESNNVEIFNVYYIDYANLFDPRNNTTPRLKTLLSNVRNNYSGLIAINSGMGGTRSNPFNVAQYQEILQDENVDLIFFVYGPKLFEKNELTPTINELPQMIKESLLNKGNGNENFFEIAARLGKPFIFHFNWNSAYRQNDFEFFEPADPVAQDNPHVLQDLSDQVRMYEGMMQAIIDPQLSQYINGLIIHGYFWNDQFDIYYPPNGAIIPASGHKAPNIRNKPVEKAIKLWFDIFSVSPRRASEQI